MKKVQKRRYTRISETLQQLENEDGDISIDEFWKIKKSVSREKKELPSQQRMELNCLMKKQFFMSMHKNSNTVYLTGRLKTTWLTMK